MTTTLIPAGLPQLPTTISFANIGILGQALTIATVDVPRMINDFKTHKYGDAGMVGIEDVLTVAGMYGVPGTAIAATLAPYVFAGLCAAHDGATHVPVSELIKDLTAAHTNLGLIITALDTKQYVQAGVMGADDVLAIVSALGGGPAVSIARVALCVGFYVAEDATPINFVAAMNQMIIDTHEIKDVIDGTPIWNEDYPDYRWSALKGGWVYDPRGRTKQ